MNHTTLLLACAALAASGHCAASSALLEVLDRDDNGYLTLDETENKPQLRFRFSEIDRNRNDRLDPEEMQLLDIPPSFGDFDVDESLGISPEEAAALQRFQDQFSQLDRNEDLLIEPAEFSEFRLDPASG